MIKNKLPLNQKKKFTKLNNKKLMNKRQFKQKTNKKLKIKWIYNQ